MPRLVLPGRALIGVAQRTRTPTPNPVQLCRVLRPALLPTSYLNLSNHTLPYTRHLTRKHLPTSSTHYPPYLSRRRPIIFLAPSSGHAGEQKATSDPRAGLRKTSAEPRTSEPSFLTMSIVALDFLHRSRPQGYHNMYTDPAAASEESHPPINTNADLVSIGGLEDRVRGPPQTISPAMVPQP